MRDAHGIEYDDEQDPAGRIREALHSGGYVRRGTPKFVGEDAGVGFQALPPGFTFTPSRVAALDAIRALLADDDYAAGLVAATVSTVQSATESRPAFVKRIVRAWLKEMANA